MNKISTLKRASIRFAAIGLVIFGSINANAQCASGVSTTITTTCPTVTETFTSNSFTAGEGFVYDEVADNYISTTSTISPLQITSPYMQIVGNILTIGGQISEGSNRIATATVQVIENGSVICTLPSIALNGSNVCVQVNGLNNRVVQFRFIFNRKTAGGSGSGTVRFDNFGIDPVQTILPVTFTSFNAKAEGAATKLSWNVAQQDNVNRYEVERSNNGNSFSKIGQVAASDVTAYSFVDAQPAQGAVFYRIKNIDNDGKFKYSTVVSLKNGAAAIVLKAFPLPAKNNITVQHANAANNAQIRISSQDGRQLKTLRPAAGTMQTSIDLSALIPGLYILSFDNGNGVMETTKLVKQ